MNIKYRRLKGTRDILLHEAERWRWMRAGLEKALRERFVGFLRPMLVLSVACLLLLAEPDFGAAIVLLATALVMLFVAGAPTARSAWPSLLKSAPVAAPAITIAVRTANALQRRDTLRFFAIMPPVPSTRRTDRRLGALDEFTAGLTHDPKGVARCQLQRDAVEYPGSAFKGVEMDPQVINLEYVCVSLHDRPTPCSAGREYRAGHLPAN